MSTSFGFTAQSCDRTMDKRYLGYEIDLVVGDAVDLLEEGLFVSLG